VNDIDIVPLLTSLGYGCKRFLVIVLEVRESLIRENYAPAESIIWAVALQDCDLVRSIQLLHQDCKVESRRSASDDGYFHYPLDPVLLGESDAGDLKKAKIDMTD
jgi:hypothetical protein